MVVAAGTIRRASLTALQLNPVCVARAQRMQCRWIYIRDKLPLNSSINLNMIVFFNDHTIATTGALQASLDFDASPSERGRPSRNDAITSEDRK